MASSFLPSSDLRHSAMESKRFHDHKAKWAHGTRSSFPRNVLTEREPTHLRPEKADTYKEFLPTTSTKPRAGNNKNAYRQDADDAMTYHMHSDSSDEDVKEPGAVQDGDEGVFYSFDAPNGPAAGEHLLSAAITKAVERFEVQETRKIEKEYEIVPMEAEQADGGYVADDDDFEIVDPVRL